MSNSFHDAVIIGAGHNSLACAMVLCAKGWSVLVLEQAGTPGGAVKSGEYTAPGFRHDWAAMNLSLLAGSPFFKEFGEELGSAGLEFVAAPKCFSSVFQDGSWLGIGTDRAANEAALATFSKADSDTWSELSDAFPNEAEHIFAILGSPFSKRAFASNLWKLWRGRGLNGTLQLVQFLTKSPRAWLDQTFESPQVKATLAAWGMHLDFAPDISGGALFPYLESMADQSFGMVIGKGGADTVVRAMISRIEASGGEVRCGSEVRRIIHESGVVKGVELADGSRVDATKAVIANVSPGAMRRLAGDIDPAYDRGLDSFRHAPGTMMVHLAMEDLPQWSASPELRDYAYVHLAPSVDHMARTYQQAQAGWLPDEPIIVVGQPTTVDPTRAPTGKHVLWMQVRVVPGTIRGDAAGSVTATDWKDAAEPMAERALDILEQYAPDSRSKIIAKRIVTPRDLEADNPNLVGGDQICGSHHLSQHFFYRPILGRSDGSTPIRNLHHTGAAVWPGAGTGAGSGYLLGKKLTT